MPLVQPGEVWSHPGGDASPVHEFIYFVCASELQGWTEARTYGSTLSLEPSCRELVQVLLNLEL